jgi:hypothetical protein
VNFEKLVKLIEAKCMEINGALGGDKGVLLIARDISEKPSETV